MALDGLSGFPGDCPFRWKLLNAPEAFMRPCRPRSVSRFGQPRRPRRQECCGKSLDVRRVAAHRAVDSGCNAKFRGDFRR
jgi:hypothetical protein